MPSICQIATPILMQKLPREKMTGRPSILTKRSNFFGLQNEVSYIKFLVTKHGEDNKFHPKLILQGANMLSTNRDMILNTYFALIAHLCLYFVLIPQIWT